jgi:hypothetical protein
MSTFDYASLRVDVLEILEEFGNSITLTRAEDGATYDPVAGTFSGGGTTNLNGVGVLVGYSNKEIDGTEIRATDRKLLFQGDALLIGDLYNGWRVHAINNIDPDESGTILTIAQMRK